MTKPCIGVLPLYDDKLESYWMLPGYMKAVEAAGGIPVMLPLTADEAIIAALADRFDGFLFTGGHDVHPRLYGEEKGPLCKDICEERDTLEYALFHRVLERDKPIFGICRGLQMINVALGGSLYQDLPEERPSAVRVKHLQEKPYDRPVHRVAIAADSPLCRLWGADAVMVNSSHHQGIKRLAEDLKPMAFADDGLIEAVYMPDKTFVWAVQWHPELMHVTDGLQFRLFLEFVSHCKPGKPFSRS